MRRAVDPSACGRSSPRRGLGEWWPYLPYAWSVLLAILLLGPALAPGYVLTYDMVWVPDLSLTRDALGLGSGLPRAVPSDALVAVIDQVVPGVLLQKVVLVGSLVGAGTGVLRVVPELPVAARLLAVTLVQWNPYVGERLLLGHWPMLVTYALLPWILAACSSGSRHAVLVRGDGPPARVPQVLWLLVPLASLSASGGLAAGVVVLVSLRPRGREWITVGGLVLAANAPWVVSGLLHVGAAATDAAGGEAFALRGEGSLPGPVAALALGGVWNGEVVPPSMAGIPGWLLVGLLVLLSILGLRRWWRTTPRGLALGLVGAWAVGWSLAVLTWAAPAAVGWLSAHLPGAGLLRDGSRLLVLCAPLVCALVACGAAQLSGMVPRSGPFRSTVALALAVLPITLLPDLALGLSGRLRPTEYPREWAAVRAVLDTPTASGGDALLLPFSSYRQPGWNHDRKVLDPAGRFVGRDYVANDELQVSRQTIVGEDPRAAEIAALLADDDATERGRRLAASGIGTLLIDRTAPGAKLVTGPGSLAESVGTTVHVGPLLQVVRIDRAVRRHAPVTWRLAMAVAWVAYVAGLVAGVVGGLVGGLARAGAQRDRKRGKSSDRGPRC